MSLGRHIVVAHPFVHMIASRSIVENTAPPLAHQRQAHRVGLDVGSQLFESVPSNIVPRVWASSLRDSFSGIAWAPNACSEGSLAWCLRQVRISMGLPEKSGLDIFKAPTATEVKQGEAPPPLQWRHLTICMDMGSDGFAGMNFAQQELGLNVEPLFDPSHGSWRDCQRMIRESNLMSYWLVLMMVMNLLHGPFLEDARYNSMQEALREVFASFSPGRCVLFGEYAKAMLFEAGLTVNCDDANLAAMWQGIPEDESMSRKHYKVNMNRFWHGIERAKHYAANWTKYLYLFTYMAVEGDVLNNTVLKKLILKPEESSTATSSSAPGLDDRALRGGQVNALATSVLFLSERMRFFKLRAICKASEPFEQWFRHQAHILRSVGENSEWLVHQCSGGYMDHVNSLAARFYRVPWVRVFG